MSRYCAINLSSEIVYLDHICPLASLLKIPLIVSDERNANLIQKYYREVDLNYWPDFHLRFEELARRFDALIGCQYWLSQLHAPFLLFHQKKMRLILSPHGQSDKGYKAPCLDEYANHQEVLVYGDLMKKMLKDLHLFDLIASTITVGNFRYAYYQLFKERLLNVAREEIFSKLDPSHRTLLYAPTWNDKDGSTTFFDCIEKLIKEAPPNWNIIVKMHPLLASQNPAYFYQLSIWEEKNKKILLLQDFPYIYPILDNIDAYLGDYSSIGYDVLAFQKPMFFLTKPDLPQARLHSCGQILDPRKNFFSSIEEGMEKADAYLADQTSLYHETFAKDGSLEQI